MGVGRVVFGALRRSGMLALAGAAFGPRRLTVLAYHRVVAVSADSFLGFAGNVSASPGAFAAQMEWLTDRFNPVSVEQVSEAVAGKELPSRAVLVTFDDGYADNLDNALPVLRRLGIPAVIFLATDHIGTARPFWWDLAAWHFTRSPQRSADLPLLGEVAWSEPQRVAAAWIAAAKKEPDRVRAAAVADLAAALGGSEPGDSFRGVLLDWDQVREMGRRGVSFGAHTETHPILTRVPPDRVEREVAGSVARVRAELGVDPIAFAYPNGLAGDFDEVARNAVRAAGVPLGFTLLPGPARRSEVRRQPLEIRRTYVDHRDGIDRFAAKVYGLARMVGA